MTVLARPGDPLSDRELEILQLVSRGTSNRNIALELDIREDTVKTHLRHVFHKLQANDRAHAVALGYQRGLIVMPRGSRPRVMTATGATVGFTAAALQVSG